eukprot:TRINITY_DN17865_c0_g1_i2.p1 TRINITY_DN17865_c0_g1~~TRINITY_DN17865_c0_g1_i2.p1  ORF type:complete len:278 (-),score=58.94 TRINITY_DN17865_c0_g1_i2:448-1281(-)
MFGGQVMYLVAVDLVGPLIVAIYQPLIPVFTVILAMVTGIEHIFPCDSSSLSKVAGVLLASGGAVVMIAFGGGESEGQHNDHTRLVVGNGLLILQCMCMAAYVLLQKRYVYAAALHDPRRERWIDKPISMTAWAYGCGAGFMWAVAVPLGIESPEVLNFPPSVLVPLAYAIVISSSMCYGLLTYANRVLSASVATSFWPLQVLVAALVSRFAYHEELTEVEAVGGLLIVVGMLVVTLGDLTRPEAVFDVRDPSYDMILDKALPELDGQEIEMTSCTD